MGPPTACSGDRLSAACDSKSTSRDGSRQEQRCRLKHTRHIEISVEHQEISIRPNRNGVLLHCEKCKAKVVMLPVEAAASITGFTQRTLYRWTEEGKVHFIEQPGGVVLLCSESLKTLT